VRYWASLDDAHRSYGARQSPRLFRRGDSRLRHFNLLPPPIWRSGEPIDHQWKKRLPDEGDRQALTARSPAGAINGRTNHKNYITLNNYQPLISPRPSHRQSPNPRAQMLFRSVNKPNTSKITKPRQMTGAVSRMRAMSPNAARCRAAPHRDMNYS
jgi:hypothetical protein